MPSGWWGAACTVDKARICRLKINSAGVIPAIFASSIIMFPATIAQFANVAWLKGISDAMQPDGGAL
jgi:preprotein translocase subunit SecY